VKLVIAALSDQVLRRAGRPPLRLHDLRHIANALMHQSRVALKRAQEILGQVSEHATLAIYILSMRRFGRQVAYCERGAVLLVRELSSRNVMQRFRPFEGGKDKHHVSATLTVRVMSRRS
jgi:hypothetical protein